MLLELAIGDAYGAGFEYADPGFIYQHNNLARYVKHPRHNIRPGSYTDDTQMSIAIAQAIVAGDPWEPGVLAQKFVETFKRDPRQGYAQGFYHFLLAVRDGEQFLREINPASDKSGAAMRAAPIGIYATISQVTERCSIQAALTHNTPDGINAAVAAALMTHYFLYKRGPKKDLGFFLEEHVGGSFARPWHGKVRSQGWMSVQAAVTALTSCDTMSDLLKTCVQFSGDVDTVAAIALAAGSCSPEIVQDLPMHLFDGLENGRYGKDYIHRLDTQLMAVFRTISSTDTRESRLME
ncbi:MAG: ADP-ribosylglycohydrolase family protein [Ktedonobacteraceae bacterium]|nr:ADP-ribosylglycohydrolase family protein [Ktedonobacteraceae bacterium]MBO0796537.1 ADP-ribosylglycohydrolase family protein [Ktedonobacteraceae bacterium]